MGEYECQHLNLGISRKAKWIHPRSEPDSGNPPVRDRREAAGNVAYSTKCARLLSIPTGETAVWGTAHFICTVLFKGSCRAGTILLGTIGTVPGVPSKF
jgi:hypothetical protein